RGRSAAGAVRGAADGLAKRGHAGGLCAAADGARGDGGASGWRAAAARRIARGLFRGARDGWHGAGRAPVRGGIGMNDNAGFDPAALTLRRATAGDAPALALVGAATFLESYAHLLPATDILAHAS